MARVIMIGCMKGGCGKTDSDYNLAYSLKKRGKEGSMCLIAREIFQLVSGLKIRLRRLVRSGI